MEYPIGVEAFLVVVATGDTATVVVDFVWVCVFWVYPDGIAREVDSEDTVVEDFLCHLEYPAGLVDAGDTAVDSTWVYPAGLVDAGDTSVDFPCVYPAGLVDAGDTAVDFPWVYPAGPDVDAGDTGELCEAEAEQPAP